LKYYGALGAKGAKTDRLLDLLDALIASTGMDQQPAENRVSMRKARMSAIARLTASIAEFGLLKAQASAR